MARLFFSFGKACPRDSGKIVLRKTKSLTQQPFEPIPYNRIANPPTDAQPQTGMVEPVGTHKDSQRKPGSTGAMGIDRLKLFGVNKTMATTVEPSSPTAPSTPSAQPRNIPMRVA